MKTQKFSLNKLLKLTFFFSMVIYFSIIALQLNAQILKVDSDPTLTKIWNTGKGTADIWATPGSVAGTNFVNIFATNGLGADYYAFSGFNKVDKLPNSTPFARTQNSTVVRVFGNSNSVITKWQNAARSWALPEWRHFAGGTNFLDFSISMLVVQGGAYVNGDSIKVYYDYSIHSQVLTNHESGTEDPASANCLFFINGTEILNGWLDTNDPPDPSRPRSVTDADFFYALVGQNFTIRAISTVSDSITIPVEPSGQDKAYAEFWGEIEFSIIPIVPPSVISRSEFSLDIGSDVERSDPYFDGDEVFDPGDAYILGGPALAAVGENGIKDDQTIFGFDPAPVPTNPATSAPCGSGATINPADYFDLDGMDNIQALLTNLNFGPGLPSVPFFDDELILCANYFLVSFDDDAASQYTDSYGSVADNSPSPQSGKTYGKTSHADEIVAVDLDAYLIGSPPVSTGRLYDEVMVHQSMLPNPDTSQTQDDDVDALDYYWNQELTGNFYFSPDHEATSKCPVTGNILKGGSIYLSTPAGITEVVNCNTHLGIAENTDIDAFEFGWVWDSIAGRFGLALLFSVDDDDWMTTNSDESGGLNPAMIYYSFLNGTFGNFSGTPLEDDVDAITICDRSFNAGVYYSCLQPTGLSAKNITATTAELSWTPGGSETSWNIEFGPSGFVSGSGTVFSGVGNPFFLTGLTPSTGYEFYVQADCGSGSSSTWAGPLSFSTIQAPFSLPFDEDFSACTYPAGWTETSTVGTGLWNILNNNLAGGLPCEMQMNWTSGIGTTRLISPPINTVGVGNIQLEFLTYYNDWNSGATLLIQSSADGVNWVDEGWSWPSGSGNIASGTLVSIPIIPSSGTTTYIAWVLEGDHYQINNWDIDNISIYEQTSCLAPTNLTVAAISATSSIITWVPGGSETSWNIEYGATGFSVGSGTFIPMVGNPYTITGLTTATSYDFYVQANCSGGNTSNWSAPCNGSTFSSQNLSIPQGWSGVSTWLEPQPSDLATMFAPAVSDLVIMMNMNSIWWPATGINSLLNWDVYSGYAVKVQNDVSLQVCGTLPASNILTVNPGWSIIPVLKSTGISSSVLLGGLNGLVLAKEIGGNKIYWPSYGHYTLSVLESGKAYYLYSSAGGTLNYAKGGATENLNIIVDINSPWNTVSQTGTSHLLAVSESFGSIEKGEIIGVFNHNNICTGYSLFGGTSTVVTIFGDDPTTPQVDGMAEGENIIIKIFNPDTKTERSIDATFDTSLPDSDGMYWTGGISAISLKTDIAMPDGVENISIFPNPAKDHIQITVAEGVFSKADISILDFTGREVFNGSMAGMTKQGVNISYLSKGVYQVMLVSNNNRIIQKLIIQ